MKRVKSIIGRQILFSALISSLLAVGFNSEAETLNFEPFSPGRDTIGIPNGYGNLQWNNFGVYCGVCRSPSEGYHQGTVSPTNVAFNFFGDPASISSAQPFNLHSAHLTAALNLDSAIEIRVQGFLGGVLLHDNTYTVNRLAPTFVTFNYVGVDRVRFTSSPAVQFAMDDLTVTFGTNCDSSIFPAGRMHGFGVETGSVAVVTQTGCTWSVFNTNSWLTILSGLSNSNDGTVIYALEENPSPLPRDGFFVIAGQNFSVRQSGAPTPPIAIGPIEVSSIGSAVNPIPLPFLTSAPPANLYFLIDQDQNSGGGAILPSVSVDWDSHTQFAVTIAAPAGMKFLVHVPAGRSVGFGGFLWWESTRGGESPVGPVMATFAGLEGTAPEFSRSDCVLSSSHGYFGFFDLEGTTVANDFSFTSLTLTGTVLPQYTGNGSEDYIPHRESSLYLAYMGSSLTNGTGLVSIVPVVPPPAVRVASFSSITGTALSVQASAGRTNVVECSEDLVRWRAISTNVGPTTVADPGCTNAPRRFYRIVELR